MKTSLTTLATATLSLAFLFSTTGCQDGLGAKSSSEPYAMTGTPTPLPTTPSVLVQGSGFDKLQVGVGSAEITELPGDKPQITAIVREAETTTLVGLGYNVTEDPLSEVTRLDQLELALKGASNKLDVVVGTLASFTQFDKTGDFVVVKAEAHAKIVRVVDGRLLASQDFSANGSRELGVSEAVQAAARELGKQIGEWVGREAAPARLGLTAMNFKVTGVPETQWPALLAKFKSDPVIIDAKVLSSDPKGVQVRLVYFSNNIPEGIQARVNRLVASMAPPR